MAYNSRNSADGDDAPFPPSNTNRYQEIFGPDEDIFQTNGEGFPMWTEPLQIPEFESFPGSDNLGPAQEHTWVPQEPEQQDQTAFGFEQSINLQNDALNLQQPESTAPLATPVGQNMQTSTNGSNDQSGSGYAPIDESEDPTEQGDAQSNTPARGTGSQTGEEGTRETPRRSSPHPHLPLDFQDPVTVYTIDARPESGRNLLAYFGNDTVERTRFMLRVERGRQGHHAAAGYPDANTLIPARTSLREICQNYPNHVWGTGLRLFMHEGVKSHEIWRDLPVGFRQDGCSNRPHNYLQQAFGREQDKIYEETHGGKKRVAVKRKRKDDDDSNQAKKPKRASNTPVAIRPKPGGQAHGYYPPPTQSVPHGSMQYPPQPQVGALTPGPFSFPGQQIPHPIRRPGDGSGLPQTPTTPQGFPGTLPALMRPVNPVPQHQTPPTLHQELEYTTRRQMSRVHAFSRQEQEILHPDNDTTSRGGAVAFQLQLDNINNDRVDRQMAALRSRYTALQNDSALQYLDTPVTLMMHILLRYNGVADAGHRSPQIPMHDFRARAQYWWLRYVQAWATRLEQRVAELKANVAAG